jgi:hypothetical protein
MVLKTQTIAPLETIYEESGSFIASAVDIQNHQTDHQQSNETINGLISARSIPSVNIQRQITNENPPKPPIEVRFRDGSKRFIQSSSTATTTVKHRKKFLDTPYENLSSKKSSNSKYLPILNSNSNKKKPPLVITIISADEIKQANLSPILSTSPSGSEMSSVTSSKSTSTTTDVSKSISTITATTTTKSASSSDKPKKSTHKG